MEFCICIDIDKSWVGIVMCEFAQIFKSYGLDSCQYFISAQYLRNEWSQFDTIWHMH